MNKKIMGIVIVVVVLGLVGGVWAVSRHKDNGSTSTMDMSSKSQSSSSSSTDSVTVQGFAFSPAHVTVKKGTTVTWTNKDAAAHTITESDNLLGPNSNDIATGKSYSFTYTQTGTFAYHCAIHPSMTGVVTVTD